MNLNDYRLNAYQKAMGPEKKQTPEHVKSVSKEIRRNSQGGHEPLVRSPVFEKINRQLDQVIPEKRNEESAQRARIQTVSDSGFAPTYNQKVNSDQAKFAAKNGTWFSKKTIDSNDVKEAASRLTSGGLVKVPESEKRSGETESIYRRVAKFLVVIGVDEAAKIIPHLSDEQTEKIIPEIASIRHVPPEEAEQVIKEFESLVMKAREEGGVDTARTILTKAYGSEKAEILLNKAVRFPDGKPFEYLDEADPDRVRILIEDESDAIQALVLSQIEPQKAAKVINGLGERAKKNVIVRLAKLRPVSPEVLRQIDKSLHEKLLTQNTENSHSLDGRGVLAEILKKMDPLSESAIISTLSDQDPELGADLRRRLFTEEDVIGCDDRYIQNKLHEMEDLDIAILLKGKNSAFTKKILLNVSKNRANSILDELEQRTQILRSESERITSQFYADLRRAWESGELIVKGRDDGEIYV